MFGTFMYVDTNRSVRSWQILYVNYVLQYVNGNAVTVMVSGVISIICSAGSEVSFSGASRRTVGCAVGVDLVGCGRLAAVGW